MQVRPGIPSMHAARVGGHEAVSAALALLDDRRLGDLVATAEPISAGIGGAAALLEVEGIPVFVKRVPLTDLERRPEFVRSTVNMFALPTFCQYGAGGPGFGVWREVAANIMTTGWVLTDRCASFPLMYHWRVLPGTLPVAEEHADTERTVAYWDGSPEVRERLEAIARSTATVVMFLEYIPRDLDGWLIEQAAAGDAAVESACAMVERELRTTVSFMNANGLVHFDAHFRNILTDGRRLFLADLGLATSPHFELSEAERVFLDRHVGHDGCYAVTELVNRLVAALTDAEDWPARFALIRRCAEDGHAPDVPAAVAAIIKRYAPVAVVMNEFYRKLHGESRTAQYPADEIDRVCAAIGFEPVQR